MKLIILYFYVVNVIFFPFRYGIILISYYYYFFSYLFIFLIILYIRFFRNFLIKKSFNIPMSFIFHFIFIPCKIVYFIFNFTFPFVIIHSYYMYRCCCQSLVCSDIGCMTGVFRFIQNSTVSENVTRTCKNHWPFQSLILFLICVPLKDNVDLLSSSILKV